MSTLPTTAELADARRRDPRRVRRRARRPATSPPARRSPAARSAPPADRPTSTPPSSGPPTRSATWRATPAPIRGNLVRRLGELLREHKDALGALVSIEAGKIRSEGLGEVQEMIDICDFAVGLSRQLHGLTIASERPGHRLMETWHPMGPCAVITAFNFPVAVWSWNAALALVAGDPVLWKPSDKTPLTAVACDALLRRAAADVGAPDGLNQVLQGGADVGAALAAHEGVAIVSATGSTAHGPGRGARRRLPLRAPDPRARRQQRRRRGAVGRPRPGRAGHRLLGRRHRRPALHEPAPADRPRVASATSSSTGWPRPTPACRSATRWPTARSSAR